MAKKYKTPNDEPQMANEPAVARSYESIQIADVNVQRVINPNEKLARTIASTSEEYEDMKAHDFYSKGTPFPDQPQTWEEVWKEVDSHEREIYLDEKETNKAMERLWSVLA